MGAMNGKEKRGRRKKDTGERNKDKTDHKSQRSLLHAPFSMPLKPFRSGFIPQIFMNDLSQLGSADWF